MQNVVETSGLCKAYGARAAVQSLDLCVPYGSVYGFIGPNGAGKTTTMKLLLGLVHPTAGSVRLLDEELTPKNRLKLLRRTGSLIESPSFYAHLTAAENLQLVAGLKGAEAKDVARVLDIVRLTPDARRKVGQFSLGMRQRLGIAMALLGWPTLLILDEPTNGLDPAGIQEMRALLAEMPRRCGATVLISSHLLSELEQIVDHVGILDKGQLLYQGPLAGLQQHSRGDVALRLLHPALAAPVLESAGLAGLAREERGELLLPPLKETFLAELVGSLAAAGAGVVGVSCRSRSLEEIFLSLTGAANGTEGH